MRQILFSAMNNLIAVLALLVPICNVLFQTSATIQHTTTEIVAFIAAALLAGLFAVVFFTVRFSSNPFQEVRHD